MNKAIQKNRPPETNKQTNSQQTRKCLNNEEFELIGSLK
jgi:hypothetical protein